MSSTGEGLVQALQSGALEEKYLAMSDAPKHIVRPHSEFIPGVDSNDGGPRDLHNAPPPNFHIQKETPEHRFLLYLFAQGNSTKEVFLQLGGEYDPITNLPKSGTGRYSYHWLCQIRRQAWFRDQLTAFLHETGKDLVQAKLQTEVIPSLEVVISVRDDQNAPSATRLAAANSLIDRFLGKPTQHVKTEQVATVNKYEEDAASLQRQLAQVEEEMKSINAATTPMLPPS